MPDELRIGDDRSLRAFFGMPRDPDRVDARYRLVLETVTVAFRCRAVDALTREYKGAAYEDCRIRPGYLGSRTIAQLVDRLLASWYVWSDVFDNMRRGDPDRLLLIARHIGLPDATAASTAYPENAAFQQKWLAAWRQTVEACRERLRGDLLAFVSDLVAQNDLTIAAFKKTADAAEWRTRRDMYGALQKTFHEEQLARKLVREAKKRVNREKQHARRRAQYRTTRHRFALRALKGSPPPKRSLPPKIT